MHAGQQITPTLTLVRPLGQGGMGSVWVADHLALGTQVAVKFMTAAVAQRPDLVARFHREATAASQIKSPHVAQVFDHGVTEDGTPYIVMELLEGEDLGHRLARLGPLPPAEVVRIVAQAAKALGRAHPLGIVHRDIKPDNLFLLDLDGEPFVKVLDFGVAKQSAPADLGTTDTGVMLGTPRYMSPEQFLSAKHVDFRSDLWALGVVAYRALTGQLPFAGDTIGALAITVSIGSFTPPSHHRPELPHAVDAWMTRALQRDPEARFGSAREMAEALALAVGGTEAGRVAMSLTASAELPLVRAPQASGGLVGSGASLAGGRSLGGGARAGQVTMPLAAGGTLQGGGTLQAGEALAGGTQAGQAGTLHPTATTAAGLRPRLGPVMILAAVVGAAGAIGGLLLVERGRSGEVPGARMEGAAAEASGRSATSGENAGAAAPTASAGALVEADAGTPAGTASATAERAAPTGAPPPEGSGSAAPGGTRPQARDRVKSRPKPTSAPADDIGF